MKTTIKPKKLFNRTWRYITLILTVIAVIIAFIYPIWLSLLICLYAIPIVFFIIDYGNRKALIEVDDEQITLSSCAIKEAGFRIKYHEKLSVKRSDIQKAQIIIANVGRVELPILTLTLVEGEPISINSNLFRSKEIDQLQQILRGEEPVETESVKKYNFRQGIWVGVMALFVVLFVMYNSRTTWHLDKTEDRDLAVITNNTQHTITLQMHQIDSLSSPQTLTIAPQQTVPFQELLLFSFSQQMDKFSTLQIKRVPRGFIHDTVQITFDDTIHTTHTCIYSTADSTFHFNPDNNFLDNRNWSVDALHVKTEHGITGNRFNRKFITHEVYRYRVTYTFTESDYEAARKASAK